jgi:hypothetical protein
MSKGRSVANDGVQIALHFWMVIQNETHFKEKVLSLKNRWKRRKQPVTKAVFDKDFTWMDIC